MIAALALLLLLSTVVLGVPIPVVFLGLVVFAAAVGTAIRPEIGLHLLVINALVGLTHVVEMPHVGPFSAPILIEGLVAAAILFQVAFFRRRVVVGTRQHALLGLLAGWIFLSVLTGVTVGPDNFQQYRNLFLVRLVVFLLVCALITGLDQGKRLVATFMISNVGLLAVAGATRLGYFGQEKIAVSENLERTGALVQNPNELAFSLTTMLVMSIGAFLYVRRASLKVLLLALGATDLFFIMSTLSRSGFISLCVVLMFLAFKLTGNVKALAVVLLLVLAGWTMMPAELFTRFSRIDEVKDVDRFQMARVGTAMAMAHPLLGVGLGNYVPSFWSFNVPNLRRAAPSHNMYLDLAAQMGLPALAAYLCAIAVTWRGLRKVEVDLRAQGATRSFTYLFSLACQAFFLNLTVFGLSGDVEFDYAAFILMGLSMMLVREHARQAGRRGSASNGASEKNGASGRN